MVSRRETPRVFVFSRRRIGAAVAFSRRLRFTFPPFAPPPSPGSWPGSGGRFISFAYIGFAAFEAVGASSGVPAIILVRNGTRSGRAGMAQGSVANGVATIPRTALDRSFIFTNSPDSVPRHRFAKTGHGGIVPRTMPRKFSRF